MHCISAGYYTVQKFEFQTTSVTGADRRCTRRNSKVNRANTAHGHGWICLWADKVKVNVLYPFTFSFQA